MAKRLYYAVCLIRSSFLQLEGGVSNLENKLATANVEVCNTSGCGFDACAIRSASTIQQDAVDSLDTKPLINSFLHHR